jgi:hypothetical protein
MQAGKRLISFFPALQVLSSDVQSSVSVNLDLRGIYA